MRVAGKPGVAEVGRQGFARQREPAQCGEGGPLPARGVQLVQHKAEQRRHHLQHCDALRLGVVQQRDRIAGELIAEDPHRATDEQGRQELPERDVKAGRRSLGQLIAGRQAVVVDLSAQIVHHTTLLDHHPFGHAGRAGGKQHIGQLRWGGMGDKIGGGLLREQRRIGVKANDRRVLAGETCDILLSSQDHACARLGQERDETLIRQGRVERHVDPARLEDRQQADQRLRRALQADTDNRLWADTTGTQMMGQLIRPRIQLTIGQASDGPDGLRMNRLSLRRLRHLSLKQGVIASVTDIR